MYVVDPLGNRTTSVFDAAGREINRIDPLGAKATFVYDAAGELDYSIDRLGRKRDFSYDVVGHETGETWYEADGITIDNLLTFTFDAAGNQLTARVPIGEPQCSKEALPPAELPPPA